MHNDPAPKSFYLLLLIALFSVLVTSCSENISGLELPPADEELILFLDDFDDENDGEGALNWTSFQNFNVLNGCVDLHGNGFYDVQPGYSIYVDMDGTCEEAGTIETKEVFEFFPNNEYIFEVWLAGNNRMDVRDSIDVSIGSAYTERFNLGSENEFELYTRSFTVEEPTEAKLRFEHYGGDDQGILVDLIRIRRAGDE